MSDKSGKPLQDSLRKRRTQEIDALIDQRRKSQLGTTGAESSQPAPPPARPVAPPPASPAAPKPARNTGTMSAVPPARTTQETIRQTLTVPNVTPKMRQYLLFGVAGLVALLTVLIVLNVVASNAGSSAAPTITPTYAPLPQVTNRDILDHLRKMGVPVSDAKAAAAPMWKAKQETGFTVRGKDNKVSRFIVLYFETPENADAALFNVSLDSRWKNWKVQALSNMILLVAPDADPAQTTEIFSHLTTFLAASYQQDFLPTPTPLPAAGTATK